MREKTVAACRQYTITETNGKNEHITYGDLSSIFISFVEQSLLY